MSTDPVSDHEVVELGAPERWHDYVGLPTGDSLGRSALVAHELRWMCVRSGELSFRAFPTTASAGSVDRRRGDDFSQD
ncbi:hypothetical protein [Microbacterium sp. ZW T5_56]|uniref:hypothetical protein n=1 Tax=Microbacterium sp. ZW T5_56 TaxID=3378081 RepID=UPI0038548D2B